MWNDKQEVPTAIVVPCKQMCFENRIQGIRAYFNKPKKIRTHPEVFQAI